MGIYVVNIVCKDRPGLVHDITGAVFRQKLSVTENQEFVDPLTNQFFMRTQFEGDVQITKLKNDLQNILPKGSYCNVRQTKPRRLVILVSRELHCLGDLLLRSYMGELQAEIVAIISQHNDAKDLVNRFQIPFHYIPVGQLDRKSHEAKILKVVEKINPDYLVLARYMRIFSPDFVKRFPARIVNIHHSFLPAFIGKDPYTQAHKRGVKIIGATAHFVTEDLDEGPIITQDIVRIDHTSSAEQMSKMGQDVEKIVLSRGLNLVLEDRVIVDGNRTIIFS